MSSVIIAATTQYPLGGTNPSAGSLITFKTVGLTGTCSVVPKIRKPGAGTSNLVTVPYTNVNTGLTVAAGTAITADGAYQIEATGPENILDATVSSGTALIDWWIVEGGVAGGSGGGGGGTGGAVTAVPGAFQDGAIATIGTEADAAIVNPALSATEIALLKGIITVLTAAPTAPTPVDGFVAAGSAASGENPVLIAGSDGTNVQTAPVFLANATLAFASQNLLGTYAVGAIRDGSNLVTVYSASQVGADGTTLHNTPSSAMFVWNNVEGGWDRLWTASADGMGGPGRGVVAVGEMLWNGTTMDRRRGNIDVTGLASAARTATTATADLLNYNHSGVIVIINVTALTATGTLTVAINGKDPISGVYYPLLTSSAIATTGTTVLMVAPGTTVAANLAASVRVPRVFQVNCTAGNSVSITYSVGVSFVV